MSILDVDLGRYVSIYVEKCRYQCRYTLLPRIHQHAVIYENEVSRHAVIASTNSQKTMIKKNGSISYITACRWTETPNTNIFHCAYKLRRRQKVTILALFGPFFDNWEAKISYLRLRTLETIGTHGNLSFLGLEMRYGVEKLDIMTKNWNFRNFR